jgi:hypothetical protein
MQQNARRSASPREALYDLEPRPAISYIIPQILAFAIPALAL